MLAETIITPDRRMGIWQYLRDIWNYRDLFGALVERDVKVRYKQTVLGVFWVVIQPVFTAGIFSVIFGRVVQMPSEGLPYPLFYLAALIPWTCFANGVAQAAGSLESNAGLISKVYFPRLIAPGAVIFGTMVDFMIGWFLFNLIAMAWSYWAVVADPMTQAVRVYWTWKFIPFTVILLTLQLSTAMGIGLVLAALNAQFRDVRYVTPFLIQVGMLISPVIYPLSRLLETRWGEALMMCAYLNPMYGVIESYRALLAGNYIPYRLVGVNFLVASALLFCGVAFFRRREERIVDLL